MIIPELLQLSKELGMGTEERFDYGAGTTVLYAGLSQYNTLTSAPGWYIIAYTYDGNGNVTRIRYSGPNQIWDNRATIFP